MAKFRSTCARCGAQFPKPKTSPWCPGCYREYDAERRPVRTRYTSCGKCGCAFRKPRLRSACSKCSRTTVCTKCHGPKPLDSSKRCGPCERAYRKVLRDKDPSRNTVNCNKRRARKSSSAGYFTSSEWRALVKKQNGRCKQCGTKARLTADHIVPLSRGGSNYIFNIQGLCGPCNSAKHVEISLGTQHTLWDFVAADGCRRLHPKARLTPESVRAIRAEYRPPVEVGSGHKNPFGYESLAQKYGVSRGTVQAVIEKRTWRDV